MKPGERVNLMQQLADKLAHQEWTDIDLFLRQFGFPTDSSGSDKRSYILLNLEQGDDEALLELHQHLFGFSGQAAGDSPDFWTEGRFRLFLSHTSSDKDFVGQLRGELSKFGIHGFCAHEDVEPTREWIDEIELALRTCDALAADLTPDFHQSLWTDQEIGFCRNRRLLILPIRRGLDPYGFIARYQAVAGAGRDPSTVASDLFRILVRHETTAARMAAALVNSFVESDSFAAAKERVAFLSEVRMWTPELLRKIEQAPELNNQISGAWGVPDQISIILRNSGPGAGAAG